MEFQSGSAGDTREALLRGCDYSMYVIMLTHKSDGCVMNGICVNAPCKASSPELGARETEPLGWQEHGWGNRFLPQFLRGRVGCVDWWMEVRGSRRQEGGPQGKGWSY